MLFFRKLKTHKVIYVRMEGVVVKTHKSFEDVKMREMVWDEWG